MPIFGPELCPATHSADRPSNAWGAPSVEAALSDFPDHQLDGTVIAFLDETNERPTFPGFEPEAAWMPVACPGTPCEAERSLNGSRAHPRKIPAAGLTVSPSRAPT